MLVLGLLFGFGLGILVLWIASGPIAGRARHKGFMDGWIARHKGKDLLPEEFNLIQSRFLRGQYYGTYYYLAMDISLYAEKNNFKPYISHRERHLLKDSEERQHRGMTSFDDDDDNLPGLDYFKGIVRR
jgi:hypothetical protein